MIRSLRLAAALSFLFVGTAPVLRAQATDRGFDPTWRVGPGFGIDMNSLSNELAPGLQILLPASRLVAIDARPMVLGSGTTIDVGGRLEVQLRSPVYLDLVRVYFGAGPQGFKEARGDALHQKDISGGWDAGVEVFLNQHFALHWEAGTSGGGVLGAAGPAFSVGFRSYPWPRSGR